MEHFSLTELKLDWGPLVRSKQKKFANTFYRLIASDDCQVYVNCSQEKV